MMMPTENSELSDEALIDLLIELTERHRTAVGNRLDPALVNSIRKELKSVQNEVRVRAKRKQEDKRSR